MKGDTVDRTLFSAALDEYKAFLSSLSVDEARMPKVAAMLDFDMNEYERVMQNQVWTDKEAAERCRGEIKATRDAIADYKADQEWIATGITVPKLLVRYSKLSSVWQTYVKKRIHIEDDDVFELFAEAANAVEDESNKDKKEAREALVKFASILQGIEDAL